MLRLDTPSRVVALRACETDDIALIKEAFRQQEIGPFRYHFKHEDISEARERELRCFTDEVLYEAINSNATSVLGHLIESGVSVNKLPGSEIAWYCQGASQATLEFLLARGWDINYRVKYDPNVKESWFADAEAKPFLWYSVRRPALVEWCLKHGASVHPRNYRPYTEGRLTGDQRKCEPILELAARCTSVATFELLRSWGAPLGRRELHIAVEAACWNGSNSDSRNTDLEKQSEKQHEKRIDEPSEKQNEENEKENEKQNVKQPEEKVKVKEHEECEFGTHEDRLAMVRHLIDNLKMDVNALVEPIGVPNFFEAPIEYIPGSTVRTGDTRDITWLLLDRGANPAPAYRMAKKSYPKFIEDVEAWKEAHGGPTFTEDMEAWEKAHNPKFIKDAEAEKKSRQEKSGCCLQ